VNTWDERERRKNLKDHGIDFADLEGFFDGDLLTREDTCEAYGEERYQSVGVFNDVPLFVVWTPHDDEGEMTRLISARKAETHEYKAWRALREALKAKPTGQSSRRCRIWQFGSRRMRRGLHRRIGPRRSPIVDCRCQPGRNTHE
jgi:uncharacterized DUF497 family protein